MVENWELLPDSGLVFGSRSSPIMVAEFMDVQCPFCKIWNSRLARVRAKYPDKVSVTLLHYPLEMHPHAMDGARALECAAGENRAEQYLDALFDGQDSIGVKHWTAFARESGIEDTLRLRRCIDSDASLTNIGAGRSLVSSLQVLGTPTVIVNGWQFPVPPEEEELERVIDSLLAGRSPFKRSRFSRVRGALGF